MKKICIYIVAGLLFSCGTVPLTGRRQMLLLPDSEVLAISTTQYTDFIKTAPLSTDKVKTETVVRVGKRIAKATEAYLKQNRMESEIAGLNWEFNLVKDAHANAFCMPGGKIVVYEGLFLLVTSDDELAVVIGHEVAHAIAKHGNERMSQALVTQFGATVLSEALNKRSEAVRALGGAVFGLGAQYGVMLPFSRKHEYEADYMGLILMTMAGYKPETAVTFWQKMAAGNKDTPPEILSTHPSDAHRIAEIQRKLPDTEKYSPEKQANR
ncbi:MAG: M48 family metallopeptidase [Tannerella sp.]|nr:M48 family metallopeptidase [Tannerella sp.]